jgi:TPR repeat protein
MYFYGDGVSRDPAKALTLFTRAAENGHPDAQFNLGVIYFTGDTVPKDAVKAAEFFGKAADRGKVAAQLNLAFMYQAGEGLPKDLVQAYVWADIAATAGNPDAAKLRSTLERSLTPEQISEGRLKSHDWKPK